MAGELDDTEDTNTTGYGGMPGLAVLGSPYTTQDAKDYAKKYLDSIEASHSGEEADAYLKKIREQNAAAKAALQQARARLQNDKQSKASLWFAAASGLSKPTHFGTLGEAAGNLSEALAPASEKYFKEEDDREKKLTDLDLLLSHVDDPELAAKLQIMKMRQDFQTRMAVKALDIYGRPLQTNAAKGQLESQKALDKAYAPLYAEYVTQGGAASAQKGLNDLEMAQSILEGKVDPKTGAPIKPDAQGHYRNPRDLTGPWVGSIGKIPFGIGDWAQSVFAPGAANVRQLVEYTVQNSLRPILGSQFTENEGERLISRVYNPLLDEATNARRVFVLRQMLGRAKAQKDAAARYYEKHRTLGPTPESPEGFKGRFQWDDAKVEDLLPPGVLPGDDRPNPLLHPELLDSSKKHPKPQTQAFDPATVWPDKNKPIPIDILIQKGAGEDQEPAQHARGGRVRRYADGGMVAPVRVPTPAGGPRRYVRKARTRPRPWTTEEWMAGLIPPNPGEGPYDSIADDNPDGAFFLSESDLDRLQALHKAARLNLYNQYTEGQKPPMLQSILGGQFTDSERRLIEKYIDAGDAPEQTFAQGGPVSQEPEVLPNGDLVYTMPDGQKVQAHPGQSYDFTLEAWTKAIGRAPTIPGLPPQEIPPLDESEDPGAPAETPPVQPVADDQSQDPFPPEVMDGTQFSDPSALELAGSAIGHGLVGALGAGAGMKTLQGAANLIPGYRIKPGERRVLTALEHEGITPDQWAKEHARVQRLGVPANATDVGGLGIRGLAERSLNPVNPSTKQFHDDLVERQKQAGARVSSRVNLSLKPDPYNATMKNLRDAQKLNSDPIYQKLYAQFPGVKSTQLFNLMSTNSGKKAVKEALKALKDIPGATMGKVDVTGMVTKPSLQFLDLVKDALDDMIVKEEVDKNGNYKSTRKGQRIRNLRTAFRDELDKVTTDPKTKVSAYKQARDQYSSGLELIDALRYGREDLFKESPIDAKDAIAKMNFSERDALRSGVAQALYDQLGKASSKSNPALALINTPDQLEKLSMVFDRPKEFEIFKAALEAEAKMYGESAGTIRKARTAMMLGSDPTPGVIRRAAQGAPPPHRLLKPVAWALKLLKRPDVMSAKESDQILKMLRTEDPAEMRRLADKLRPKVGRAASNKRWTRAGMAAGALGAAGYALRDKIHLPDSNEPNPEPPDESGDTGFAKGGLVRKPLWMLEADQALNLSLYGGDNLVTSIIR